MRNKQELIQRYSLGNVLALVLQDLRASEWRKNEYNQMIVNLAVLKDYVWFINNSLDCGVKYLNQSHGTQYKGAIISTGALSSPYTIIRDPNNPLTTAELADALLEATIQCFQKIGDFFMNPKSIDVQSVQGSCYVLTEEGDFSRCSPDLNRILIDSSIRINTYGEGINFYYILEYLMRKIEDNPVVYMTESQIKYFAIQPSDIALLKDLLVQEINDIKSLPMAHTSLRTHCLDWLSKSIDHITFFKQVPIDHNYPLSVTEDIRSSFFKPINRWDNLKPYAGKIILYKSSQTPWYKENEHAFLLYPESPDIRVVLVTPKEYCDSCEIGFRIGLLEKTETFPFHYAASPNPWLTTNSVRFSDMAVRELSVSELQILREIVKNKIAAFFDTPESNYVDDANKNLRMLDVVRENKEAFFYDTCEKTLRYIDVQIEQQASPVMRAFTI